MFFTGDSRSPSAASYDTAISLEPYQAIRVAVDEVAMTSHSSSATERGAVSRERNPASAHGTIVVRQTFLNFVSIYIIYIF